MGIAARLEKIRKELPSGVELILVSKTKSPEEILEAYDAGQRIFGESKVQELLPKTEKLPKDIQWHMVGHLQSNKVKYIVPFISLIHSVDSAKLLKVINKEGRKNNRTIPCLLQMHIADESSKFGMDHDELCQLLDSDTFKEMHHVEIRGLMGMATFTSDTEKVKAEFRQLRTSFDYIKQNQFSDQTSFREISMGMSDDYNIAIGQGSTMVRIGSAIFGER